MIHANTFLALVAEGGGTRLHPLGLVAVVVFGIATLTVPRRLAGVPIFMMACFVAPSQKLVVASIDFNLIRIMVIFAWMRVLSRNEAAGFRWSRTDSLVLAWAMTSVIAYTLLHASTGAFINRAGRAYDFLGMYFYFRCIIRSWVDLDNLIRGIVFVSVPVALAFLIEKSTGRNFFAFFGGVPEMTKVRNGRLRCQGAYLHSILAGVFWAPLLPIVTARIWRGQLGSVGAIIGIVVVLMIVVLTASSTPASGVLAAMIGGGAFYLRRHLNTVRAIVVAILFAMHMAMEAPIWHLVARIDLAGGSTGYHRYLLIDQFIKRFDEWWLFGTKSTAHWGWDMWDTANQYVTAGVEGGILGLFFFCWLLWSAFQAVGRLWRSTRDRYQLALSWALGTALFSQCVMFIGAGISHSNQNLMILFLTLALITSLDGHQRRTLVLRKRAAKAARAAQAA